jgi:hypothetical protein
VPARRRSDARPRDPSLPSTVARSDGHAQEIFLATLASAEQTYGPGERARRTAFASLKHSYEKVGDHWERKARRGPSDEGAEGGRGGETAGGVDANASLKHLREVARRLGIPGRSKLDRDGLVEAIGRANRRETDRPRRAERGAARR